MVEILRMSLKVENDMEGFEYIEDDDCNEETESNTDSGSETEESDNDLSPYSCPYCMGNFPEKKDVLYHLNICDDK